MQLTTTSKPCGIVVVSAVYDDAYLPLQSAEVHADVVDGEESPPISAIADSLICELSVSAVVTVTQRFWQHLSTKLDRAKYVFPVPAKAAVCGFEMTLEDGTVVIAEAKEKEEARRDHEAAIFRGYTTGLVEHVTDDGEFLMFVLYARC